MSTTAEKIAVVIHDMIMTERKECAIVAELSGHDEVAAAILKQPAPIPALRNIHCVSCSQNVQCPSCGLHVLIGKCQGIEP